MENNSRPHATLTVWDEDLVEVEYKGGGRVKVTPLVAYVARERNQLVDPSEKKETPEEKN